MTWFKRDMQAADEALDREAGEIDRLVSAIEEHLRPLLRDVDRHVGVVALERAIAKLTIELGGVCPDCKLPRLRGCICDMEDVP